MPKCQESRDFEFLWLEWKKVIEMKLFCLKRKPIDFSQASVFSAECNSLCYVSSKVADMWKFTKEIELKRNGSVLYFRTTSCIFSYLMNSEAVCRNCL